MGDPFTEHRSLLFGVAYRMLGRVVDAEDVVQDAYLRWQAQEPGSIREPKAWLVAAVTRLAIDQLRSARRQREEYYGVWLPEPLMTNHESSPDRHSALADSLSMAFLLLLEELAPEERAIFLLREAFGHDYGAIAAIVEKSEAACRQIVSRARARLSRQEIQPRAPSSAAAEQVVGKFLAACESGELSDFSRC